MIIDTQELAKVPGLLSATLTESAEGTSSLQLEFADWGPAWARYEEPLTLLHKGKPLWHGKMMPPVHSNAGRVCSTSVVAHNIFYMLESQPLSAQLKAVHNEFLSGGGSLAGTVGIIARSWAKLAENLRVAAPGWGVTLESKEGGANYEANPAAELSLDVSRANYALTPGVSREGGITGWQILQRMRACNPDCVYKVVPTGVIQVVAIAKADTITWDTDKDPEFLLEASGIAPRREDRLEGVAVAVTWRDGKSGGVQVYKYPKDLDKESGKVRLFSMSANSATHAAKQMNALSSQVRAYYDAVNTLQWSGTLVVEMDKLASSPLACRVNLRGEHMHPEWASMGAIVTAVEWDLVERTARLTLGASVQDPELWEVECPVEDDSGGGEPEEPEPPVCDGCDECDGDDGDEEEEKDPPTPGGCGCAENWEIVATFMGDVKYWFDQFGFVDSRLFEKYPDGFPDYSDKILGIGDGEAAAPTSIYNLAEKEMKIKDKG